MNMPVESNPHTIHLVKEHKESTRQKVQLDSGKTLSLGSIDLKQILDGQHQVRFTFDGKESCFFIGKDTPLYQKLKELQSKTRDETSAETLIFEAIAKALFVQDKADSVIAKSSYSALEKTTSHSYTIRKLRKFLIRADKVCDWIPGISALNNLADLFMKCVLLRGGKDSPKDSYSRYLQQKSISRCLLSILPGGVILYSFMDKRSLKKELLDSFKKSQETALKELNKTKFNQQPLLEEKDALLQAIEEKGINALQYASEALKNDENFLLDLMENLQKKGENPLLVLPYAGENLKGSKEFVRAALEISRFQKEEAVEEETAVKDLEENYHFALERIKEHGVETLASVNERFKENQGFLFKAMEEIYKRGENPALVLAFASDELKNDKEFVILAMQWLKEKGKDPTDILAYVNRELQSTPTFLIAMAEVIRGKS